MHVVALDLVPYRLALREPVVWNGERREVREGVLLRLTDLEGRHGWGDAAPLPGFSRETLEDAKTALEAVGQVIVGRPLDARDVLRPSGDFATMLDIAGLPSSSRFALDLALVDLAAQTLGRTIPQALHPDPAVVLPLNGLVMGGLEDAPSSASRLAEARYQAVKVKVGRATVEEDVAMVTAVRKALPDWVALRLDANRAWTWDEAVEFAEATSTLDLEYVEEPLAAAAKMPELWVDTRMPIALDETLQEPGGEASIRGWAEAIVLKPTLVGGLMASMRMAAAARSVGVRTVLSASFESGVGLRGVAAIAAATDAEPAGLDTYRWLSEDVLGPLPFAQPTLDVAALFAKPLDLEVS